MTDLWKFWTFAWLYRFALAFAKPETFLLPATFEGAWQGVPHASVIGPWSENFTFAIAKDSHKDGSDGSYLFEANLPFDASPAFRQFWSWQRSYLRISGEDRGRLLHCPGPRNPKKKRVAMMQGFRHENEVTFCLRKWPGYVESEHPFPFAMDCYEQSSIQGCGCFNWTLRADPNKDTLDYEVSMAGSPDHAHSQHLWVKLHRIPFLPSVDAGFPGTGKAFTCDYASRDEHQTELASCPFAQNYWRPSQRRAVLTGGTFQHCYNLDLKTGLVLEWDLDMRKSMLRVQISAWSTAADYVSIGFRPLGGSSSNLARDAGTGRGMRFGMAGADIVLGHSDGIQQYYAATYSGMPEPDTSLHISQGSTERRDGRIYLQFQRPLVGGRLLSSFGINASIVSNVSDMMWAVGKWDADAALPGYHGTFRGWREVNWTDPEFDARPLLSLRPYKCTQGRDGVVNSLVYP